MLTQIRKAIGLKRTKLIQQILKARAEGALELKADAEMRLRFLISLQDRLQNESLPIDRPTLFISYSRTSRDGSGNYYARAEAAARSIGFEVHNGFRRTLDVNVLRAVRSAIAEASTFLAVMTPEIRIAGDPETYAPSVWVVEEKGMALGLNKPFRMLVHHSVHRDFWMRTTPGSLHHVFDQDSFDEHLENALQALHRRHHELQLASVGPLVLESD